MAKISFCSHDSGFELTSIRDKSLIGGVEQPCGGDEKFYPRVILYVLVEVPPDLGTRD
jgi:hypothetical protein